MNKIKISLAAVITALSAFVLGFVCFLGYNFESLGNTIPSILKGGAICLLLAGLMLLARHMKGASQGFKTSVLTEMTSLLLFGVVAGISTIPFSHYFTVLSRQEQIKASMSKDLDKADELYPEYTKYVKNRLNMYENKLKSVAAAKLVSPNTYNSYGFVAGTPDETQIENKIFTLKSKLIPTNFEVEGGTKQVNTKWLEEARNILESKRAFTFGIISLTNDLGKNTSAWSEELKILSTFRAKGESSNNFSFSMTAGDITEQLTKSSSISPLAVGLALLLFLLMSVSYFAAERHGRFTSFSKIFNNNTTKKENEL